MKELLHNTWWINNMLQIPLKYYAKISNLYIWWVAWNEDN